jgi:hypothetical protein
MKIMSKMKSNCTWSRLTAEQRDQLERWLMEQNMSYQEAKEQVLKEWGIEASIWSVRRFYQRCINEQGMGEVAEVQDTASEVNETTGANLDNMCAASWKAVGARVLEKVLSGVEVKELAALGRLVAETEWTEIQRGRLVLARERFEFNAAKAALAMLPKLAEMNQEDREREEGKVKAVLVRLFGKNHPR